MREAAYPAVQYILRKDVDMARLERTDHTTYCPYKGDCSRYQNFAGIFVLYQKESVNRLNQPSESDSDCPRLGDFKYHARHLWVSGREVVTLTSSTCDKQHYRTLQTMVIVGWIALPLAQQCTLYRKMRPIRRSTPKH